MIPADQITGVNTLLFSASTTPVPDIVALAATLNNNGIVNVSNPAASSAARAVMAGAFAVATVNVGGAGGAIMASADRGDASLPLDPAGAPRRL